ncbi:MAG: hypothetical protein RI902_901 [Pseudomonadota bacterium]|jgi:general secretion pathway protein D
MRYQHFKQPAGILSASVMALLLAGCAGPDIQYSMSDAKSTFKSRQLAGADINDAKNTNPDNNEGAAKPRRKLVQFRYAPQSFENPDFQAFLKRLSSESAYVTDITGATKSVTLSVYERQVLGDERNQKRRMLVVRDMQKMQGLLSAYDVGQSAKLQGHANLTLRETSVAVAMRKLSDQTAAPIRLSDKLKNARTRVSGDFQGSVLSILQQMSRTNGFEVRFDTKEQTLWVLTAKEAQSPEFMLAHIVNPLVQAIGSSQDTEKLAAYRELLTALGTGQPERFTDSVKQLPIPTEGGMVAAAYDVLVKGANQLNQNLKRFDAETKALLSGKISLASVTEGEISPAVMSKGLLDRNVCPGQELITEKLFIYQESPKEVVKFLENYFKSTNTNSAPPATNEAVAKPPQAAASDVAPKAPVVPVVAKDASADRCANESTSVFKVIEDPTGIIVTGTAQQIELAVRLTDDVDIATKQVLAEVFLVEVQKNWERTIQTKFGAGNATRTVSVGAVGNVVDAATLATSKGINGMQGKFTANSPDIEGFINLLETNAVGRNISSPTLIAKNGEEAEINKVITLRKTVQTVVTAAQTGAVAQPALPNQQVQKLDVPLKLKIKPIINQHNKHVTLRFEYEETSLNPDPADSPIEKGTTKNSITTTLETAPGEVVVLAGLFKEANSQLTNSLPGISGMGVFSTLFGGSNALSTQSTELLVFIKPTVIEPKSQVSQVKSGL